MAGGSLDIGQPVRPVPIRPADRGNRETPSSVRRPEGHDFVSGTAPSGGAVHGWLDLCRDDHLAARGKCDPRRCQQEPILPLHGQEPAQIRSVPASVAVGASQDQPGAAPLFITVDGVGPPAGIHGQGSCPEKSALVHSPPGQDLGGVGRRREGDRSSVTAVPGPAGVGTHQVGHRLQTAVSLAVRPFVEPAAQMERPVIGPPGERLLKMGVTGVA